MKHARQVIREAVVTMLAGIGVTTYRTRFYPFVTLPAIAVYGNTESASSENELINAARRYTRELDLTIEVAVEAVSDADDLVDDYAAQVEAAIAADLTLAGTATDAELYRTDYDFNGEGEKPIAIARLSFRVWYRTTAADPENAIV